MVLYRFSDIIKEYRTGTALCLGGKSYVFEGIKYKISLDLM